MPVESPALRSSIETSVNAFSPADWRRIFGEQIEGRAFYRVLETSALPGFAFRYVAIYRGERLVLLAPVFWSEFDLAITVQGRAARAVGWVRRVHPRFLRERTLFCGSPFGEHGDMGVDAVEAEAVDVLEHLLRALRRLCAQEQLAFLVFKDVPAARMPFLRPLERHGFIRGESFPNACVPLPKTYDAYLAALSSNARKELRRKVRQAESRARLHVRVVRDVADAIEPVYQLYRQTLAAGTVRFETLTREYFLAVGREMAETAVFFLFYADDRLVGFNLCFHQGDQLVDKFIGLDYAVARRLNLYFYTWDHNVRWCIAQGIRSYQVGQTDYGAKVHLGAKLVPLWFWARYTNSLRQAALRIAARVFL